MKKSFLSEEEQHAQYREDELVRMDRILKEPQPEAIQFLFKVAKSEIQLNDLRLRQSHSLFRSTNKFSERGHDNLRTLIDGKVNELEAKHKKEMVTLAEQHKEAIRALEIKMEAHNTRREAWEAWQEEALAA